MEKKELLLEKLCFEITKSSTFFSDFIKFLKGWKKELKNKYSLEEFTDHFFLTNLKKAKYIPKIESLPIKKFFQERYELDQNFFQKLSDLDLCLEIQREAEIHLLLSPEGYAFFDILDLSKRTNPDSIRPSIKKARSIQGSLLQAYRNPYIVKILGYSVTADSISLTKREIATVLFFLINGNIEEKCLYDTQKSQILRAIPNYLIKAFTMGKGRRLSKEERENVVIRLFEKDLFYFSNEKLFSGIFNEKSKSYILKDKLSFINEIVQKSIIKEFSSFENFNDHWSGFLEEFQYFRNILDENQATFYKKSAEIRLIEEFEKLFS